MTGNKEAHLKIEVECVVCTRNTHIKTLQNEVVEMKLLTDVEGSGEAQYRCPECHARVILRVHLSN